MPFRVQTAGAALCLLLLLAGHSAHAHLVLAQRGTVNIVDRSIHVALSLPVSGLKGFDDDHDGAMSAAELTAHYPELELQVRAGIGLQVGANALQPDVLTINTSPPDRTPDQTFNDEPPGPAQQLVVMARFTLPSPNLTGLALRVSLFGKQPAEQQIDVVVTRAPDTQLIRLTPQQPVAALLPAYWPVFTSYVVLGFEHIASGLDHMLFLLVVVSTGWSLRRLLLVLTWFTLGHAVTLTASLLGLVSVSPAVVEPAIAATIIGMALLDFWALRQTRHGQVAVPMRTDLRFVLIFACALIHGLGLADALSELGLDSTHRWLSLAGFNLGIELCQVAFAVVALSLVAALRYRWGPVGVRLWSYLLTSSAIAVASVWLVQRVVASQAA